MFRDLIEGSTHILMYTLERKLVGVSGHVIHDDNSYNNMSPLPPCLSNSLDRF